MPESALLVAIAAHGLAGSRADPPTAPLSPAEWFDLVQACVAADLVGFLALAAADHAFPVTPGQTEELSVLDAEHTGLSLLVERRALTMAALLTAGGIDHRVVDGPARRLAYGDSGARQFRVVQVLVPPARLDDAFALQGPPPGASAGGAVVRRERLVLRASLVGRGPASDQARPAPHGAAGPDPEPAEPDLVDLLGPAGVVEVAGRPVSVLTLEQQLVAVCVELAPVASLVQLRDVAQLALSPGLDARRTRRLAERARVAEALAGGVALAWQRFDLADKTELSVWALRMTGVRARQPHARSTAGHVRVGLAQRVFGRRQPTPAAPGLAPIGPAGVPSAAVPPPAALGPSAPVTSPPASVPAPRSTRR